MSKQNEAVKKYKTELEDALGKLVDKKILGLNLELVSGRGKYSNIKWWRMRINSEVLPDKFNKYTHVNLMPYKLPFEQIILELDSSREFDIDFTSGNIHLLKKAIEVPYKVEQLVLVTKDNNRILGPKYTANEGEILDFNYFQIKRGKKTIILPKVCYYPSVTNAVLGKEELEIQKMLKTIWEKITPLLNEE